MYRNKTYYFRILFDYLILNIAFLGAVVVVERFRTVNFTPDSFFILIILNFIWYFVARNLDLYDMMRVRNFSAEMTVVMKSVFVQILSLVVLLYMFREMALSRYFVFTYAVFLATGLHFAKALIRPILHSLRKHGRNLRHMVIVGARETGLEFNEVLKQNPYFGYNVLGFIDDEPKPKLNGQYLGRIQDLKMILTRQRVDDVVVTLPANKAQEIRSVISVCDDNLTRVKILPDYFPFLTNNFSVATFGKFPVISVRDINLDIIYYRFIKRAFDMAFTSALFIFVFSWLWPIIALGVKITTPGPVFFKQERWGRDNRKITCYKFRSMRMNCSIDENGNYIRTQRNDPRITSFGRFIRKTNLDELPQFWNVLKGEMSVVGPRPHATPLNIELKNTIQHYTLRHLVKPGITGWAQVKGYRGGTRNHKEMQKRFEYDLWYVENWNYWLDIQIIFMTIWRMLRGDENAY
jgi:putative colanic acid biosysnthesis UDP-glucose lipid carrier transferase